MGGRQMVVAVACPSREGGRGTLEWGQPRRWGQSQVLWQRQQKQLWLWLLHWAEKGLLHWWMEGLQPLLSWGEVGQVERGPWGATAGTCLEEREAGGPGGSWGAAAGVVGDGGQVVAPDPQVQGVVVTELAVMHEEHPYGR